MNEIYYLISIIGTSVFLICGLMILFTTMPYSPLLGNYRKARYIMAGAYLFFAGLSLIEYLFGDSSHSDIPLMQTITLSIAFSQALLFTLALLSLLEVKNPMKRDIFCKAVPVVLMIVAIFTVYIFSSKALFTIFFNVFAGIYALFLVYYTRLFLSNYRRFRIRMDNYFSSDDVGTMHWITFSFFTSLAIGVMALLAVVFMSLPVALLAAGVFILFYLWFAIRFINYALQFHNIERAMDNEPEENKIITNHTVEKPEDNHQISKPPRIVGYEGIGQQLEQWVAAKGFTEKHITVDMLAGRFYTNRSYLSSYINNNKGKTFRVWINELRIEETKTIIFNNPDITLIQIAEKVGFSDKSHFIRQFTKQTGVSPNKWKQLNQ